MECVFFFKKKTEYEMCISDWSSDVCSSDLRVAVGHQPRLGLEPRHQRVELRARVAERVRAGRDLAAAGELQVQRGFEVAGEVVAQVHVVRSAEHTSELQSLMRSSYAVLCRRQKPGRQQRGDRRRTEQ